MGFAQGDALKARIQKFVTMRLSAVEGYFKDRGRGHLLADLIGVGRESFALHAAWDPDGHEEQVGIAAGANVDPVELFTVCNMTDMRDAVLLRDASGPPLTKLADAEGCSSVLVPGSHTLGNALVGQTWDLNPPDVEYVVAIHRVPDDGPKTWSVTCTGCLSLVGINEHGVSVGTTNIKTYGSQPGVGYLSILHRAVRARDAQEARELVKSAPHAGAHTYWIADAEQQLEWEASPNGQFLRTTDQGPVFRTNHCIADPHRALQGELPSESSQKRFARISELVSGGGVTVESLRALFADRTDGLHSINRYEEDDQGTATNAVFIAEPAQRRAFACRGPADRGEWIELTFE